jgi:hypothetical protein
MSPLYQYILDFSEQGAPSGAGFRTELRPLYQLLDYNLSEIQLLFAQLSNLKSH